MIVKGKRILHLIGTLKRGGTERQLALILSSDSQEFEDRACTYTESDYSYVDEYELHNKIFKIGDNKYRETLRTIRIFRPDIIVAWSYKESILGLIISKWVGVPFINASLKHGIFQGRRMDYIRNLVYRLSDTVIANSKAGITANRLTRGEVIYNGLSEEFYKEVFKKRHPREDNKELNIVSLGNLTRIKNHLGAIEVVSKMDVSYRVNYRIFGNGILRKDIEERISRIPEHIGVAVSLRDNTDNVLEVLSGSDILLHLSFGEGCSNTIIEAMSSGLCVIAGNTGGTPELIDDGVNGFLVDPSDTYGVMKILVELGADRKRIAEIGNKAKEKIEQDFEVERYINEFRSVIKNILQ